MDNNRRPREIYIPPNVFDKRKFNFRTRNIAEAIIFTALFLFLLNQIPFVFKIKAILSVVFGLVILGFFLVGIKKQSVTEWVINRIKNLFKQKTYHYRKIEDTKNSQRKKQERSILNESYAEKIVRIIKEKLNTEE